MELQTINNLTNEEFINYVESIDVKTHNHCDCIIQRLIELAELNIY